MVRLIVRIWYICTAPVEPEILINKPPSGEFPPSPGPFPVSQPEKPEPLMTRVPLLGIEEYLEPTAVGVFERGRDFDIRL
jgi:hypothetical protein